MRRLSLALGVAALWTASAHGDVDTPLWEAGPQSGETHFGSRVGNAGDIDGDGRDDIFVTATDASYGRVYVLSGLDGSVLRTFTGNPAHDHPSVLMSAVSGGDLDGDGAPDFLLGARRNDTPAVGEHGYIMVVSSKLSCNGLALSADCGAPPDPCVLRRICGAALDESFGERIANVGDLDGDGTIEILVGLPGQLFDEPGEARVYSGADSSLLFNIFGVGSGDSLGYAVAGLGDVTGDGVPDFAIGAPGTAKKSIPHSGQVLIYSGATHALVRTLKGGRGDAAGSSLAGLGLVNGDRVPDIVYGSPGRARSSLDDAGQVWLVSGRNGKKLRQIRGTSAHLRLGSLVAPLGDVDGDGAGDFATAPSAAGQYGRVGVYSGKCGCGLFVYYGEPPYNDTDTAIAGADVTGDGRQELIVGLPTHEAHPSGIVRVFAIP